MVQTSELRYGNIFIDPESKKYGWITGFSSRYCRLKIWEIKKHIRVDKPSLGQNIIPIELTSDILLKLGTHEVDLIKGIDRYLLGESIYAVWDGSDAVLFRMNDDDENNDYLSTSDTLHHLQNLYFFLTGKELPVNNLLK